MARGYVYEDDATGWRLMLGSDLPNSGVTAATYGDATHVAQVAVNAQGLVTSASNVAITAASGITDLTSTGSTISVSNPTGPTTNVDLPSSGVSANTYGNATHVAQFAVNAEGVITSASNVAIGGISGSGLVLLFDSTLGSAAASIDTGANAIPAGHGVLFIWITVRTDRSGLPTDTCAIQFNGDTGSNYLRNETNVVNVTVSGIQGASTSIPLPTYGNTGPANYASAGRVVIPDYDNTTFTKSMLMQNGSPSTTASNGQAVVAGHTWNNTAAINQVTASSTTGSNLVAGSRMQIYGAQ